MTVLPKQLVKNKFLTGDKPTQGDYGDLIDSYQDYSDVLNAIAVSASAGGTGIPKILSASAATLIPIGVVGEQILAAQTTAQATNIIVGSLGGTVGLQLLATNTTVQAQDVLGATVVGKSVFNAASTAAAQSSLGGTVVGRQVFEASTTVAAQRALGASPVGIGVFEAATTVAAQSKLGGSAVGIQIFEAATTAAVINIVGSSGLDLIQANIVSNQGQADLTGITSTYDDYLITGSGVVPATDGTYLRLRYSTDNGSNYLTTGYASQAKSTVGGTTFGEAGGSDSIYITPNETGYLLTNTTVYGANFVIKISGVNSGRYKISNGTVGYAIASSFAFADGSFTGAYIGAITAINAVRFLFSSGNISGEFRLYGLKRA